MIPAILLSHGSPDPLAQEAAAGVAAAVARTRGAPVVAAFLQHGEPDVTDASRALARAGHGVAVLVPMLLSNAFHARWDVPEQRERAERESGMRLVVTDPLGADPILMSAIDRGLPSGPAVLAAAGSTDPRARDDVASLARTWAHRRAAPVTPAFASQSPPDVATAVTALERRTGAQVSVASLLQYPGVLASRIRAAAGPRAVSGPLHDSPELRRLVRLRIAAGLDRVHRPNDGRCDATD